MGLCFRTHSISTTPYFPYSNSEGFALLHNRKITTFSEGEQLRSASQNPIQSARYNKQFTNKYLTNLESV